MLQFGMESIQKHVQARDRAGLLEALARAARAMGEKSFKKAAARQLLDRTLPHNVIPDNYAPYRPVVRDGVYLFLSKLSLNRLLELAADQILMDESSPSQERLIALARQVPTLQKLGQILARNKNLDPGLKKWLIQLESAIPTMDPSDLIKKIESELSAGNLATRVTIERRILAEASVAAAVPFSIRDSGSGGTRRGVFKVIKPGVREKLLEELSIIDEIAAHFDRQRKDYELRDFKFIETFREIRDALAKEIDLDGEQENLRAAASEYENSVDTRIPGLFSFSTPDVTAMERLGEEKITDASLPGPERKRCARILFENLICRPLFSVKDRSLFHGDPHAGNIHAMIKPRGSLARVALLDWSLAGRLSKRERMLLHRLMMTVILGMRNPMADTMARLSWGRDADLRGADLENLKTRALRSIDELHSDQEFAGSGAFRKLFILIDGSALAGMTYGKGPLLFRKAFFTLEGVLYDLDPDFDMDVYLNSYITRLIFEEFPWRYFNFVFPTWEIPESYRLSLSNRDLTMLMYNRLFALAKPIFSPIDCLLKNMIFGADVCHNRI